MDYFFDIMIRISKMFKKIWDFISGIGVYDELKGEKRRNITLLNQLAFTWIPIVLIYACVFIWFNLLIPAILLFGLALLHVLVFILNKYSFYNVSRLLEVIVPTGVIYIIACLVFDTRPNERVSTMYMLNLSFFIFPFLFFSLKEIKYIIIGISASFFYVFSFDWMNSMIHLEESNELFYSKGFEYLNYVVASGLLIIGFVYMKNTNYKYQKEIKALLKESEMQNARILQQKKEIEKQRDEIKVQRDFVMKQGDKISIQNEEIRCQRDSLLRQQKEITDSIYYAKRIQTAIFPPEEYFGKHLSDYFVLLKPRDIVSGDFYWLREKDSKIFVAAADCTGHGVPGAFMSILGITFLNEIVNKYGFYKPSEVLDGLRNKIITSLNQRGKEGDSRDGMDISLCVIDEENNRIQFSGANNPLFIIRDGELVEMKGDKMPVGIHVTNHPFYNHEVSLKKGDSIYIFSDGFSDQFGGEKGKKFKIKNFKTLLLENWEKPMEEQKAIINYAFDQWRGDHDQVDDILVIGIRFEPQSKLHLLN